MNCYLLLYVIVPLRDFLCIVLFLFLLFLFFSSSFFSLFPSFSSLFFFPLTIQLLDDSGLTCVDYCRFEAPGKLGRYTAHIWDPHIWDNIHALYIISTLLHTTLQLALASNLPFRCKCGAKACKWQSLASMYLSRTYKSKES